MTDVFKKPFYEGFLKKHGINQKPMPVYYPYSEEMFRQNDIFPLFVLDSGAFLFVNEHIGGAEGRDFIEALDSGKLLRPWMRNKKLIWDRVYDENAPNLAKLPLDVGPYYGIFLNSLIPVSQHAWLNRLDFLLPVAHQALITKEPKWDKLWYEYFYDWVKAHPYPPDASAHEEKKKYRGEWERTKFIWYDMQVTCRLLVLIHSVFLLSHNSKLTKAKWHTIYDAIILHVNHVYKDAAKELKSGYRWNHFLQKGTALLYTGLLFSEMPEAGKWVGTGRKIIAHIMKMDIMADGGSVETCPSYSHFIARLFLDAHLLLQDNHQPAIRGLKTSLRRQYGFLRKTMSPTGKTLQLSDSYALDAELDLEIVSQLFPLKKTRVSKTVFLKDSCMTVMRNEQMIVCLDGTPLIAGHAHPGKPNLILYIDGKQAIVDPGSPNYDSPERNKWFKSAHAHNIVLVESAGKVQSDKKAVTVIQMVHSRCAGKTSEVTMKAQTDYYTWFRTLRLTPEGLEVLDEVKAKQQVTCEFLLHFAESSLSVKDKGSFLVTSNDWKLLITDRSRTEPVGVTTFKKPAFNESNNRFMTPGLSVKKKDKRVHYHYLISCVDKIRR